MSGGIIIGGGGGAGDVTGPGSATQYQLAYWNDAGGTELENAASITASRALISDANGLPTHSAVTSTELALLSGKTSVAQSVPHYELALRSGNNWGSTATKIRRFTNTDVTTGNTVGYTYADSATNGMSVTILVAGRWSIYYNDTHTSSANFGVSRNASSLTTNIYDLADPVQKIMYATAQSSSAQVAMGGTFVFAVNDVIRVHGEGLGTTNPHVMFRMVYLGPVV